MIGCDTHGGGGGRTAKPGIARDRATCVSLLGSRRPCCSKRRFHAATLSVAAAAQLMHITRFQFPRSSTCSQLAAACRCAKCCQRRAPRNRQLAHSISGRTWSMHLRQHHLWHKVTSRCSTTLCSFAQLSNCVQTRCASVHSWSFDACQRQPCALPPLHSSRESLFAPHACQIRRRLSLYEPYCSALVHLPRMVCSS